jgi:twitching motility protein PilT
MPDYDNELERLVAELNRVAPGLRNTAAEVPQGSASTDQMLAYAARRGASDMLIVAGAAITLRVDGVLAPAGPILTERDTCNLMLPLLTNRQYQELQRAKSVDFCFASESAGRCRANIHYQRGTLAGSIRLLPGRVPTLESLHLPAALAQLLERRQGLVLVTGPTGCGKTSTLAALINVINTVRNAHIVTIEDPIEFVHPNRLSVIEQIEVGHDAPDFATSVRSILRQNPDVILVGEMRDAETIATVLTAAETGHLVFSTLHTNDTSQTVSRILDSFPAGNQPQIRQQLSLALLAVIAQQLVPGTDGGRYPVLEVLVATPAVRNLIRRGEDHQLYSCISTSRANGMVTMEQSLAEMVRLRRISRESALAHCFRHEQLCGYLDS